MSDEELGTCVECGFVISDPYPCEDCDADVCEDCMSDEKHDCSFVMLRVNWTKHQDLAKRLAAALAMEHRIQCDNPCPSRCPACVHKSLMTAEARAAGLLEPSNGTP